MEKEREFGFTDADFERVRKMIYAKVGISFNDTKKDLVYSRLSRRLRATGFRSFDAYLSSIDKGDEAELEEFTNALTTNLTAFFREPHHFPLLADHLRQYKGKRPITLWCSACSTGEEAYSMAMTVVDLCGGYPSDVRILATDIDSQVLDRAMKGVYEMEKVEKVSPGHLKRFFMKGSGKTAGYARVKPELREMITFRQLNLLDVRWPMRGPFDAIFCRNVMIYFDKKTQYEILKKFVPLMQPDGLLFAGHSESFYHAGDLFRSRGKTVYELVHGHQAAQGRS